MTEQWLESQNACYAAIVNDDNYKYVHNDGGGAPGLTKIEERPPAGPKRAKNITPTSCIVVHDPTGGPQRVVGIAVDPIQYPCDSFSVQVSGVVDVQFRDKAHRITQAKMVGMDLDADDIVKTRARVLLTPFRIAASF